MNFDPQTALQHAETLLLDMDGTLLDLAFDNYMWGELVPRRYAAANGMSFEEGRDYMLELYSGVQGELKWYCLDHWCGQLGIDVVQMHYDVSYRIGYLPGALEFLRQVRERDVRVLLVTNAHPDTLALKDAVTGLGDYFDGLYSSHTFGYAKEHQDFWRALQDEMGFDRESTLFIDDSQPVLRSADAYGIGMLVTVTRPDSTAPRAS
ncbi:MAG: GMP/IMP nucleotidase [Proteobacteria bacterium]|nr:GMP/IMP nucleotidase [Pseudomonadota bacterium]